MWGGCCCDFDFVGVLFGVWQLSVETYGCWGTEAMQTLSCLVSRLATRGNCSKSHATCLLYGRLSLTLMRANARALLSRAGSSVEDP